ncbi:uncharacterized protein LOC107364321 isoform X2 [Tetranychus urticae]|uniref:uncharacterized protein LOC107364321 isoform X2 n=1 Tax=Tetranychus urticae TaxID=32264 RepID=UPI000D653DD0|nr:uncharacterized protein LOC107364321 isoform X2 [Tetranychus urticae]
MKIDVKFSFLLCFLYLIDSVHCDDFKCPERGKVGELKVPNVLSLIRSQTGYQTSVEVNSPTRSNFVDDYFDGKNNVGYFDMEVTVQDAANRLYYYHSTEEKITVRENTCTRFDLTQNEKFESIKDWFEPKDIVASSEIFKDLVHLGPTVLMIYGYNISDKASFIGSELIEGRTVNHWFYCTNPNGPYIDFYFDVKTSLPHRFSLYYPEWIETQEVVSVNETRTVKKQVDSDSKYVYNFYMFKPLVASRRDQIPYPLSYGCARKGTHPSTPLPDFSQYKEFNMDMEAIITYSGRDPIKTTARVMKRGDVISYEIQEGTDFVRSIEMPPPLGRFQVDEHSGRCNYLTSDYSSDVTLITRWPFHQDRGFNLLYYLVMKPPREHAPTFIGEIPLGPLRVEEYRATNFFANEVDAIVDYYYTRNTSNSVPSKVIFNADRNDKDNYYGYADIPTQVEVTIVHAEDGAMHIDFEDRFDVSGCYEEPGSYTWFQLLFSNPWLHESDMQMVKESTEEYLASFIPITRFGLIYPQQVDSNVYVTVKLYDRVHFIEAYRRFNSQTIINPSNILQSPKVEDCEQLCSANPDCNEFSYCDDYTCSILTDRYSWSQKQYKQGCTYYARWVTEVTPFVDENYLSTMEHVLQQIRNKVSAGEVFLRSVALSAEDLFIVSGPEEIGDISQELHSNGSRPLRAEDFPMLSTNRHFDEAQFKIEKSTLQDCFMACVNDDDCNTLSYCINQNKECILSGETSSSLKDSLEDKTSHADGCNIYQKSFMNLFHEYPGKSLVLDAVSTISNVPINDCAKRCAQSSDFSCESFDYCQDNDQRNESVCFLHVNHIEIDKAHQMNATNWKLAEAGCSHYSKKSELDYELKVELALKENTKEAIVGTFDHLSLEHCASRCNSDPNCFTLEFCESIDYDRVSDSSVPLTSCSLTNLKPGKQPGLFEVPKSNKICSIYINHKKITDKSKTDPQPMPPEAPTKSGNLKIAIGLGAIVCLMAFAGGFVGFKFAIKKGIIS